MNDINEITQALIAFRDERDWAQFHSPKDLALALSIEANELLEAFLWKTSEQADPAKVKEELADVFAFAFLLSERYGLDVKQIVFEKIAKNSQNYPVALLTINLTSSNRLVTNTKAPINPAAIIWTGVR